VFFAFLMLNEGRTREWAAVVGCALLASQGTRFAARRALDRAAGALFVGLDVCLMLQKEPGALVPTTRRHSPVRR
jgi:hypothetical protein